jgi:hypothetical protein
VRIAGAVIAALLIFGSARNARADEDAGPTSTSTSTTTSTSTEGVERGEETDPTALFKAATDALASDRPTEAIAKLEALGDRGIVDAVVSYDRGLAYAARVRAGAEQPGDLGRSAHGFEEARELSHDDALVSNATTALAEVRAEVSRRRSRAGDPIEIESGVSLGRSIVKLLPENVWAVLAAICSLALSAGIVLRGRAQQKRLRVAGSTTCAIAGGLLVVLAVVLSSARDTRRHVREAVVIAPNPRLLDEKHVALMSVAPLPEGARVELLDEGADFAHVLSGRAAGWLPSGTVLPIAK